MPGLFPVALAFAAVIQNPAISPQDTVRRTTPARSSEFGPLADHHQHLLSPAGVALLTPPFLPEIKLPQPLASVVRERTRRWNDQEALAELYTENSLYFAGGTVGWVRGRETVAGHVRWTVSDTPYFLKPVTYDLEGSAAKVAGYFVEADGTDRHFGFFLLVLNQESKGTWRIAAETYVYQPPSFEKPFTADQLVARLDSAGIRRAVVLSDAYYFDAVRPAPVPDEYRKVRAENDWTAEQVARFPDRLVPFCSFNPLRDYALEELNRCASSKRFTGIKLHFNAAQLDFQSPEQVSRVREVMRTANGHRLPIIVHVRSKPTYGRKDAEVFLRQLVSAAPDVVIQVAHLWGGENYSGSALAVYAEAVASGDPVTRNLYFDVSGAWRYGKPAEMKEIAANIRRIGLGRILYGSDGSPADAWKEFRSKIPLREDEFRSIAGNVAPYLERRRSPQ